MPNYRPDLLPFALPVRIGLPYHGLVTNGALALPDSTTMEYSQPSGGSTVLVQHPLASTPAGDQNAKYAWKDYALLSGDGRAIGTHDLGPTHWIYCDDRYSWDISFEFTKDGIQQTITVWLEGLFGVFPAISMERRQLGSLTYTPKSYSGVDQSLTVAAWARKFFVSHSKTGDITIINIGAQVPNIFTSQPWDKTSLPLPIYPALYDGSVGFHDAIKITIAGNGSLSKGEIGNGITALVALQRQATDMIVEETSTVSNDTDQFVCAWEQSHTDERFPIPPCPPTQPAGTNLGVLEKTHYDALLVTLDPYEYQGTDSQQTTTTVTRLTARFLDTVMPSAALSFLEYTVDATVVDAKTVSIAGSGVDYDVYMIADGGCYAFGHGYYEDGPYISGSNTISASRAVSATYGISVSWCGAEKVIAITATGSSSKEDVATTYATALSPIYTCAPAPDLAYKQDGVDISDEFDISVYKVTNNILQIADAIETTLITIVGGSQEPGVFVGADEASLNPATGQVAINTSLPICWV